MVVAAMRIRLPDLDQRIGYRYSIAVEDAPLDAHALTGSLRLGQHIAAGVPPQERRGEERAPSLGTRYGECTHDFASPDAGDSKGVASDPRTTMSQRYPSAHSGSVTVWS